MKHKTSQKLLFLFHLIFISFFKTINLFVRFSEACKIPPKILMKNFPCIFAVFSIKIYHDFLGKIDIVEETCMRLFVQVITDF